MARKQGKPGLPDPGDQGAPRKRPKAGAGGKAGSTDIPSWARGEHPAPGENGKDFARRLCDDRYGPGKYPVGPGSEYNKLKKFGDRHFSFLATVTPERRFESVMGRASLPDLGPVELWTVGLNLHDDDDGIDYYFVYVMDHVDRPLLVDDRIAFFPELDLADRALELARLEQDRPSIPVRHSDLVCDFRRTVSLLREGDYDPAATIVNFLNVVLDLVAATPEQMPLTYRLTLSALADHLTFEREYGSFFARSKVSRSTAINAVLWCLGVVTAHSRVIAAKDFEARGR